MASVQLTCPSITVEHPIGAFLKVGPYFSGKFSLYYLDTNNKVYFKIVSTLAESGEWIKTFFDQEGRLDGLEKYDFTFNSGAHFFTNPFEYTVDAKAIKIFLRYHMIVVPFLVLLCLMLYLQDPEGHALYVFFFSLSITFFASIPIILLLFNYLVADKKNYLQISKGNNEFVYCKGNNRTSYNKQAIKEIIAYGVQSTRLIWRDCEVFKITFNNGEKVKLTSLLINGSSVRRKLPEHQIKEVFRLFPTI